MKGAEAERPIEGIAEGLHLSHVPQPDCGDFEYG